MNYVPINFTGKTVIINGVSYPSNGIWTKDDVIETQITATIETNLGNFNLYSLRTNEAKLHDLFNAAKAISQDYTHIFTPQCLALLLRGQGVYALEIESETETTITAKGILDHESFLL